LLFFIDYSEKALLIAVLIILPLIIDGLSQLIGYRESNNKLRFITGLNAGIGIALLFSFFKIIIS